MNYKEFFTTENKSGWKCVESKLANKEFEIYSLVNKYSIENFLLGLPFNQQVWQFIEQTPIIPTCLECGNKVKYRNITLGYQTFCGLKCSNKNEKKIKTTKNNLLEKYGEGITSSFKIPSAIEKSKQSNMDKFGVDNHFKLKSVQENIRSGNLSKFGFGVPSKNEKVREKTKETNLKRYGHSSYLKLPEIKEKIRITNLQKYSTENPFDSKEYKEQFDIKRKATCLRKYGQELFINTNMVQDKIREFKLTKTSKIEKTVCDVINGKHKFIYNNREYDMVLNKDIFEVDGDFFHPSKLENLSLLQINSAINDYEKINSIKNSEYTLYKVKVSDINKLDEITADNLKAIYYIPDYSLTYNQKIITKEYLTKFIEVKGKDKLAKYVKMILKFIRTFQPEFPSLPTYENLDYVLNYVNNFNTNKMHNKEDNSFNNRTSIVGCNYLKSTFKSFWCSKYKKAFGSPIEIWNNDKIMERVIAYRIGLNNSNEVFDLSLQNLISGISAIRGTVSFFKPIVAGAIYKHYLVGIDNPRVFDPCCGFGGRMLGFKAIYPNGSYVGCEPNLNTYNELIELGNNFKNVEVRNIKLEDNLNDIDYDLCFTSIPYFDLEDYNNGVEYEDFDDWKDKFIKPLLGYKKLIINMPHELCLRLGLEEYIDGYLDNGRTHFNKDKIVKREVLIKMNF